MKRFFLAFGLCSAMLATAVFVFMPTGFAKSLFPAGTRPKENVLEALLDLPAPPPPNPLESATKHDDAFYDPKNPPPDNAPIDDLIDYWSHIRENYRGILYYTPKPSARVVQRLLTEGGPSVIPEVIDMLPDDKSAGDAVKQVYDDPGTPKELKASLRNWLTLNSSYFSEDTAKSAGLLKDVDNYVSVPHQNALLALTRHDWDVARPIVDRLYADASQPVSRALATWALYRHAMETGDLGDTERYRSELMRMVENRQFPDGVRDMANDAIVREPDFQGRDEWCWSLFEDETLVNMPYFTGLTTLIMYAPPDKYVAKMTEFLKSSNKTVRTAAVRNLITAMEREKSPEVVRALMPWIGDPKWIDRAPDDSNRVALVMSLQSLKMPESVPGLINALDEKATRPVEDYGAYTNSNSAIYSSRAVNAVQAAANAMANAARSAIVSANTNSTNSSRPKMKEETYYPLREHAVRALAFQGDPRAAPALKRLLNTTEAGYQRAELIAAILACGGYSVPEQVDALEKLARRTGQMASANVVDNDTITTSNSNASYYNRGYYEGIGRIVQGEDLEESLGLMVSAAAATGEPSDELVHATVARIEKLEPKDPITAQTLRKIITGWKGLAVSAILLSDLKTGKAESDAIVRLLADRKSIKEKLGAELEDSQHGTPIAAGISACLFDDQLAYKAALESRSLETQTAVIACSRLIRAELPLAKVAEYLRSTDALLKTAAALYIESEDSPEARSIVYSQHAGEAKVLGARAFFPGRKGSAGISPEIISLFTSVNSSANWAPYIYDTGNLSDLDKTQERLQKELKAEPDLVGVYAYEENFVRIYKDKVSFSWDDDPSRYHERYLSKEEFDRLKELFNLHHVSELKPFLSCSRGCGQARELLMLGKNGGSRVFARSERMPQFFTELEKVFSDFRAEPSAIKYALSKDVPGLELLFASDEYDAQTVWKHGGDLRVAVGSKAVREKVDDEIRQMEEDEQDPDDSADDPGADEEGPAPERMSPSEKMRIKRQYEGISWHHVENGRLADSAEQPNGIEFIPSRDQFDIQPDEEQWKARTTGFEIRAGRTGLYKISAGRMTKLKEGNYSQPVVSANGRWLVVNKFDDEVGPSTVRYNLITNREIRINFEGYENLVARCFVPALGKFLLASGYYNGEYYDRENDEEDTSEDSPNQFYLLDPETGSMSPIHGETRPLAAQSFRALQPADKPNEFWAALPNHTRGDTVVGIFDSRLLRFTPLLKLPKINFDSMDMWVDEPDNKVYFVYSGHLLRIPLKNTQSK